VRLTGGRPKVRARPVGVPAAARGPGCPAEGSAARSGGRASGEAERV